MNLSRKEKLALIQSIHRQWWQEHPEIEPGQLGSPEAEAELSARIEKAIGGS